MADVDDGRCRQRRRPRRWPKSTHTLDCPPDTPPPPSVVPPPLRIQDNALLSSPLPLAAASFGTGELPPSPLSSRSLSRATTAHALLARMRSTAAAAAPAMTVHGEPPPRCCCRHRHRHPRRCRSSRRCMRRWEAHGGWWSDIMHVFPPLLGWVQATQAQLVLGKTEGMMDGWCWG